MIEPPLQLVFQLVGGSSSVLTNDQLGDASVIGDYLFGGDIVLAGCNMGPVTITGNTMTVSVTSGNLICEVYGDGGMQTFEIDVSCARLLMTGDQFGASKLIDFSNGNGDSDSNCADTVVPVSDDYAAYVPRFSVPQLPECQELSATPGAEVPQQGTCTYVNGQYTCDHFNLLDGCTNFAMGATIPELAGVCSRVCDALSGEGCVGWMLDYSRASPLCVLVDDTDTCEPYDTCEVYIGSSDPTFPLFCIADEYDGCNPFTPTDLSLIHI